MLYASIVQVVLLLLPAYLHIEQMANDIHYDPVRSILEAEPDLLYILGRLIDNGYTWENIASVFNLVQAGSTYTCPQKLCCTVC